MSAWLSLQEYSYQKGISVSTLRRKIKNEDIVYKLKNGRYFLKADSDEQIQEKNYFANELKKKEQEFVKLKHDYEDAIHLVHFLEAEKQELLKHIENEQARAN